MRILFSILSTLTTGLACGLAIGFTTTALAQSSLPAVDVTAADINAFIDALPEDRISDRPIRVVELGGHKAGIYGVFRPADLAGQAIRHQTPVAEIYYMLQGSGTLVTGGSITEENQTGTSPNTQSPNFGGSAIINGVSRRVGPGDVIFIPGNVPHWWSSLDSDIRYLIFRTDPEGVQPTR